MTKTSKLFEYGIEAAKVGAILTDNQIPTTTEWTQKKSVSLDYFYAPTKDFPEANYLMCCMAVIDALLELYRPSYFLYHQIVDQWGESDCRQVLKKFEKTLNKDYFETINILSNLEIPEGEGWNKQENLIIDFIKRFCNRQSDVKKGKILLTVDTSPYFSVALVIHSVGEHLERKYNKLFDKLNEYRGWRGKVFTDKKHSRDKDKIIQNLKNLGFEAHYGKTIRESAVIWVKARILSDSLSAFAAEKKQADNSIRRKIKKIDKAMGYDQAKQKNTVK